MGIDLARRTSSGEMPWLIAVREDIAMIEQDG